MRPARPDPRPPVERGAHALEVRAGTVVGFYRDDVLVELEPRSQGVISARKLERPPRVGEVFELTLRRALGQDG